MAPISSIIEINTTIQKVFDVVTELQSHPKWLPDSTYFHGTTETSESPVKLGTTYIETSPAGIRHGKVIEFEAPSKAVFVQPMTMNPVSDGVVLDIKVEVILKEKAERVTTLERNVYLGYPESLQSVQTSFDKSVAEEGDRVVNFLKQHAESSI